MIPAATTTIIDNSRTGATTLFALGGSNGSSVPHDGHALSKALTGSPHDRQLATDTTPRGSESCRLLILYEFSNNRCPDASYDLMPRHDSSRLAFACPCAAAF